MIETIAQLLKAFSDHERAQLDAMRIEHAPTIGAMYEGLTRDILDRAIPPQLHLRVLSGFAYFKDQLSGELDCMLVRGEGQQIPYTEKYRWHISNVIAVFEVKKTLTADDLADSYNHLRTVARLYSEYVASEEAAGIQVDLRWPRRVFGQITGIAAPPHDQIGSLSFDLELIYRTLTTEFLGPVRIVLGHHGWKREQTLRNHIAGLLKDRLSNPAGMGVGSFPQLIIGGNYSLVKANGFPYVTSLIDGMWPFLISTSHNPVRVLLELLFSRIDALYSTNLARDRSNIQEVMSSCLRARAVELSDRKGWEYIYDELTECELKERGAEAPWEPAELTSAQFTIICRLCNGDDIRTDDPKFSSFVSKEPGGLPEFIKVLTATRLVAVDNMNLRLTTINCTAMITPDGKFVAGENNAGQMQVWSEHKLGKPLDLSNTPIVRARDPNP
ncbi:DUF6602 domain-containing protein [Zavarzinella formosa]|uniref:DUF6602 domain-containing protein n=1 Tax=Zavarzinella formosa TaxID=360055 RepID=UPI000362FC9B|nr:DUF6602 domain-containing protein [Zavarzinella formosa]